MFRISQPLTDVFIVYGQIHRTVLANLLIIRKATWIYNDSNILNVNLDDIHFVAVFICE